MSNIDTSAADREQAVRFVLMILRTPVALLSPDREDALALARKYQITAEDLLTAGRRMAKNA